MRFPVFHHPPVPTRAHLPFLAQSEVFISQRAASALGTTVSPDKFVTAQVLSLHEIFRVIRVRAVRRAREIKLK